PSTSDPSRHKYNSDKSELTISAVTRSDFGEYVCTATNKIGNNTAKFILDVSAWPGTPDKVSVAPGPSSSLLIQSTPVRDGGSSITEYILQWKKPSEDTWRQSAVKPTREPNSPILSLSEKKLDKNSVSIPIKQLKDGGSPILGYIVRYKGNKENEEWTEKEFPGNSSKIQLNNLQYDADYQMEVYAVNNNGSSSSAKINFTVPQPVSQPALGKGGVVGIVMFIFLILMVSVDAFCCYTNHCGLLNFLARKLFGHNISESKGMDEEANNSSGKKPESGDPAAEA
ncbi:hypothetical protein cypCar_00040406, partial [Cyprinus carpio]